MVSKGEEEGIAVHTYLIFHPGVLWPREENLDFLSCRCSNGLLVRFLGGARYLAVLFLQSRVSELPPSCHPPACAC